MARVVPATPCLAVCEAPRGSPEMKKGKASEELLAKLHNAVATDLLKKVESGEATAQELSAAIKFLKDNGIEAERTPGSTVDKLAQVLPAFDDDEEHSYN